jgi:translation initiation factor 1 (eIF-1/SUI1)
MADAPAWRVRGTKKGDWPIDVEKRKHHTVTVLRNVSGDAHALCTELQDALGAGGTVRGSVVELQGAHTDRCIAFLSERRRHVAGVRAALLPDDDDDDEEIPLEVKSERRKPRWDATRKMIGKHEPPRATAAQTAQAVQSGVCPLDFSLVSFRDACAIWWRCTCPKPDPRWLEPGDDAAPFYDPKLDGPTAVARDVCEVFTLSSVSRVDAEAPHKTERARKMEARAHARQAERDKRKEAAARRREPVVQASSRAFAAKSRNAWLDDDDVNEGLGRLEDDWSEEEDIWDDDAEEWRVATEAASGADATRDIEDWNAAVRAAHDERARAGAFLENRAPVVDDVDASQLSDAGVLARADAKGWSETYVGLLMDSLGGRFQDLEPTLWRKVLALVSSGADAHDAVLSALADVVRPAWACAACTLENEGAADFCVVCATPRGAVESAPPPARPSTEWTCAVCTLRNRAEHLACDVCGAERDAT